MHDEVLLEGPVGTAAEALPLVVNDMAHPFRAPLLVDLNVDAKICSNWHEAK